jgi:predicted flap endonuclease-1-like 5' DNA nuclease
MWDWNLVWAIWLCLLIAAILGGIIGWLLKSLSCKKKCDALYADLSAKDEELARLRASLSKAKGDASAENTKDDGEIAALKAQISKLEGSLTASANLDADWKSKYSLLQTDLTGWKDKHGKLEADFAAKAAVAPVTVEKIVEKIVEKPVEVIKTVEVIKEVNNDAEWSAKFAKLEADLRISHDRQYSMEGEIKKFAALGGTAAVASGVTAAAMSGGNDDEIAKLKAEIANLETKLKVVRSDDEADESEIKKLRAELASIKIKLDETEGERTYLLGRVKSAEAGEVRTVVPMDQRDDLELIHGVGPVIERMLYDEGIYFFKDVAGWGEVEIEEISAKLPQFKNRIRRENWIDSAKEEHFKKYGEKL